MTRKGTKASSRRVNLQSRTKAITKPATKVVIHWMKMESLSPIPARIFSTSLQRKKETADQSKQSFWSYKSAKKNIKKSHGSQAFFFIVAQMPSSTSSKMHHGALLLDPQIWGIIESLGTRQHVEAMWLLQMIDKGQKSIMRGPRCNHNHTQKII